MLVLNRVFSFFSLSFLLCRSLPCCVAPQLRLDASCDDDPNQLDVTLSIVWGSVRAGRGIGPIAGQGWWIFDWITSLFGGGGGELKRNFLEYGNPRRRNQIEPPLCLSVTDANR